VVPNDYSTPKNTLFKARALHYAAQHVDLNRNAWVIHMDEESFFDAENAHKFANHFTNQN